MTETARTAIYTLSLHDALPISGAAETSQTGRGEHDPGVFTAAHLLDACIHVAADVANIEPREKLQQLRTASRRADRKSTRLNSSHGYISYAVFCLKKKKT